MTLVTATHPLDRFFAEGARAQAVRPAVDLVEYEDRIELLADLPGLSERDIEVQYEDGTLSLRGERKAPATEGRVLRQERTATRYARSFALGEEVDVDRIEAAMRDGVLRITLPKSERARPRHIPVTVN
jgi:HSP20 family protein